MMPLSPSLPFLGQYFSSAQYDWNKFAPDECLTLEKNTVVIQLKKNEVLFEQGEHPKGIYRVVSGKVKFYKAGVNGGEQVLAICSWNDIFGYRVLITNEMNLTSASALEPTVVELIPREVFLKVLRESVVFSNMILLKISLDFGIWINRSVFFAQSDIRTRLAVVLLILNEKFKSPKALTHTSSIHISRTDLAAYIGSSLEALVRALKKFAQEGLVSVRGKNIVITNLEHMLEVAGTI